MDTERKTAIANPAIDAMSDEELLRVAKAQLWPICDAASDVKERQI